MDQIEEKLHKLEVSITKLSTVVESQNTTLSNLTNDLHSYISKYEENMHGNGGRVGVNTKIDRIENTIASWTKHLVIIWTAIVGGVVKFFYDIFVK